MASLVEAGTGHPAPYSHTTPSGRVITWPDPMGWSLPQAAAWLTHLEHQPVPALFGPLLDVDDRRALSSLATNEAKALAAQVLDHYVDAWASPPDLARLAWLLSRHPGPVLWDLTPRGVDVRAWVAGRRWADLASMLDQLPSSSAVHQALQDDPDWVQAQVQAETDAGGVDTSGAGWRPALRDYDLTAQQLADISARIDTVAAATMQVAHEVAYQHARSKPAFRAPKTQGFPAPRTLLDIHRDQVVADETWALYGLFQPSRHHTRPTPEGDPAHGHHLEEHEEEPDDRDRA